MAGKEWQAHSLLNKALQADTASRRSVRHRPHNKRTAHSWPAAQQEQQLQTSSGLSLCSAGRWGECNSAGSQKGGLRPTYLSLPHLTPLPVTVPTHSLNL